MFKWVEERRDGVRTSSQIEKSDDIETKIEIELCNLIFYLFYSSLVHSALNFLKHIHIQALNCVYY